MLKYLYIHFMQLNKNFKRTLGLYTAISLVIGSVIGSGIFMRKMYGELVWVG